MWGKAEYHQVSHLPNGDDFVLKKKKQQKKGETIRQGGGSFKGNAPGVGIEVGRRKRK